VAYAKRFVAAVGDFGSQNLFSDAVLACLFQQDPRYFRRDRQARFVPRIAYSLSRIAVARQDSGRQTFNASGVFGMALGIGASNLYYPSASLARHSPEVLRKWFHAPEAATTASAAPVDCGRPNSLQPARLTVALQHRAGYLRG
jgi:hypothetical protein